MPSKVSDDYHRRYLQSNERITPDSFQAVNDMNVDVDEALGL
jgi:hypothetical protein